MDITDIVSILVFATSAKEWVLQIKGDNAGPQGKSLTKNLPVFCCGLEFHLFGWEHEMKQGDIF